MKHAVWLLVAMGSFLAGATLAWNHPLWPMAVLMLFWFWFLLAAWRPGIWLLVVPSLLPLMNFSPWTGWLVFEEFDILLLGALAGGYARLACSRRSCGEEEHSMVARRSLSVLGLCALLAVTGLIALLRGFADAGGFAFDWFAGYTDALNSVRVFKSMGFALLFVPLLQHELDHAETLASQRLASGMLVGLTVVTLAALWERAAFPGLLEFSKPYRTVALFWEMHVGGAAIDGYLALAMPFVVWALMSAQRPARWAAVAALAILSGYVCLTTFSRGVYLAVAVPLLLLGVMLWAQTTGFDARAFQARVSRRYMPAGWRARASVLLLLALAAEIATVLGVGSFMRERLNHTDRDYRSRTEHWQHGLALLDGPADWLLGKGLGRLPANYAMHVPDGEFSGGVAVGREHGPGGKVNSFVTMRGPATDKKLGGQFALTQRVADASNGLHGVSLDVRVQWQTDVLLELCERHLLYDGHCQTAFIRVAPSKAGWQNMVVPLAGTDLTGGPWYAPRMAMLSLSVVSAGGVADFDHVSLIGPHPRRPLENADFAGGLAHWFPAAQSYFVPWHIDNLFLDVLIERGAIGLLIFVMLVAYALWRLLTGHVRPHDVSVYLAASLCGAMLVGLVGSLTDVPRVAFLFNLLALYALVLKPGRNRQ